MDVTPKCKKCSNRASYGKLKNTEGRTIVRAETDEKLKWNVRESEIIGK